MEIPFAGELADGEMKVMKVGDGDTDKILISKVDGQVYAIGAFCSHFGVPLASGQLFGDKVICPAHAAAFNVTTGELENNPGYDSIPKYEVAFDRDSKKYFVTLP